MDRGMIGRRRAAAGLCLIAAAVGCMAALPGCGTPRPPRTVAPAPVEAASLLGEPLRRLDIPRERRERLERDLAAAKLAHDATPTDEDAIIWVARRLGYLGRYNEAVEVLSRGLTSNPQSSKILRHRGHRFITLRQFNRAVTDLTAAAALIDGQSDAYEPDGAPNALNVPRSTNHTNIWYHLALAHYLRGEFEPAAAAWRMCVDLSPNDDMRIAALNWLALSLHRLGRTDEAIAALSDVREEMDIIENYAYHRLTCFYRGDVPLERMLADDALADTDVATITYGVGAWLLGQGHEAEAGELFQNIVSATNWAAFGHIAAEADLARLRNLNR